MKEGGHHAVRHYAYKERGSFSSMRKSVRNETSREPVVQTRDTGPECPPFETREGWGSPWLDYSRKGGPAPQCHEWLSSSWDLRGIC